MPLLSKPAGSQPPSGLTRLVVSGPSAALPCVGISGCVFLEPKKLTILLKDFISNSSFPGQRLGRGAAVQKKSRRRKSPAGVDKSRSKVPPPSARTQVVGLRGRAGLESVRSRHGRSRHGFAPQRLPLQGGIRRVLFLKERAAEAARTVLSAESQSP